MQHQQSGNLGSLAASNLAANNLAASNLAASNIGIINPLIFNQFGYGTFSQVQTNLTAYIHSNFCYILYNVFH
jgi:hypothetical protein